MCGRDERGKERRKKANKKEEVEEGVCEGACTCGCQRARALHDAANDKTSQWRLGRIVRGGYVLHRLDERKKRRNDKRKSMHARMGECGMDR